MNHTAATGALHNGGVSRWITTYRYLCLQPARSATAKMDSTILPVIGGIHSGAAPPLFLMLVVYSSSSSTAGKPSRAVPASVRDQRIVRPAFTPSTNPSPCSSLSLSRRVGAVLVHKCHRRIGPGYRFGPIDSHFVLDSSWRKT